jgi:hypothetical protein
VILVILVSNVNHIASLRMNGPSVCSCKIRFLFQKVRSVLKHKNWRLNNMVGEDVSLKVRNSRSRLIPYLRKAKIGT